MSTLTEIKSLKALVNRLIRKVNCACSMVSTMKQLILFVLLLLSSVSLLSQSEGGFGFRRFANKAALDATSVNNSDKSASRRAYVHSTGLYYRWNGTAWVVEETIDTLSFDPSINSLSLSILNDGAPAKTVSLEGLEFRYWSVKTNMPYNNNDPFQSLTDLMSYWFGRNGLIRIDTTVVSDSNLVFTSPVEFLDNGNLSQDTLTSATFNDFVQAEPKQYVFTGSGTYSFNQKTTKELYPYWFGALGNGTGDDQPEIQKTINAAISSQISNVKLIGGVHLISKGVLVRNGSSTVTLTISGVTDNNSGIGTELRTTDSTNFVIGIQGSRNVLVENLSISGKFTTFNPNPNQVLSKTPQLWRDSTGRQSRYSPYSGVVIDPLTSSTPADGGYSGFTYGANSTSDGVYIKNVSIKGFTSGISVSPHGANAATNIFISDSKIYRCFNAISTGSVNNIGIQVDKTVFEQCKTGMSGNINGTQLGVIPYFSNGRMVNIKDAFMYINNAVSRGGVGISNSILNVYRLGGMEARAEAIRFTNVEVNFMSFSTTGFRDAASVLDARDATFLMNGGRMVYSTFRAVEMYVRSVRLNGVYLHRPIMNLMSGSTLENMVYYDNCKIPGYNAELSNNFEVKIVLDAPDLNNLRTQQVLSNQKLTYKEKAPYSNYIEFTNVTGDDLFIISTDTLMSVNVDTTLATAQFVSRGKGKYRIGDVVYATGNSSLSTPFGLSKPCSYGIVTSISSGVTFDTVRTSYVPNGTTSRGGMRVAIWEMPRFTGTYRGNLTSGSNKLVVTSKQDIGSNSGPTLAQMWPSGMRVFSDVSRIDDGLRKGIYVISVIADTLFLSGNSDTTINEIEFFNAEMLGTYHSKDGSFQTLGDTAETVGYRRGDEIKFYNHPYRRKATITRGGFDPIIKFEFKNIYGLDADKPTPEAIDTGLTYFSIDSNLYKLWTGTEWITIGGDGTGVNLGNSDLIQDDPVREFRQTPDQVLGFGTFPSLPSIYGDDGRDIGYFYEPGGEGVGLINGDSTTGAVSKTRLGQTFFESYVRDSTSETHRGYIVFNANAQDSSTYFSNQLISTQSNRPEFSSLTISKRDNNLFGLFSTGGIEGELSKSLFFGEANHSNYDQYYNGNFAFGVTTWFNDQTPFYWTRIFAPNDTTSNSVTFYNDSYRLVNDRPSSSVGDTSFHVWVGNGTGTTPMFLELDDLCNMCDGGTGGGENIYNTDDLLKAGGTTVGLDSGSLKFQIPNDAAIRYGIEIFGDVDNTANRFLSMKVDNGSGFDSLWIQEDGNGFRIAAQNRDLIFQTSERHIFLGDSLQLLEGLAQTVTLGRFLLGMTPTNWVKRFDANGKTAGTFLASNGTDWVETTPTAQGYILQNGNTFGSAMTIGTNDANNVQFEVNNSVIGTISSAGLTIGGVLWSTSQSFFRDGGFALYNSNVGTTGTLTLGNNNFNYTGTSGTRSEVTVSRVVAPTSGTGNINLLTIGSTINQTGGANGTITGLILSPVFTSLGGTYVGITGTYSNANAKFLNQTGANTTSTHVGKIRFGDTTVPTTDQVEITGNLNLTTAGNKIKVATGSNASAGTATLVGGTVTVNTTAVTASSLIFFEVDTPGGTQGFLSKGTVTPGTSFVINSTSGTETSTVAWWLIN